MRREMDMKKYIVVISLLAILLVALFAYPDRSKPGSAVHASEALIQERLEPQSEIEIILGEDIVTLIQNMPLANRDFLATGPALHHLTGGFYTGPGEDLQHGMVAYDLIFSNRRILRLMDMMAESDNPEYRSLVVQGLQSNFDTYRDWVEGRYGDPQAQSIRSREEPGEVPTLHGSLLTALGLGLVAAEHNITEAHPILLDMAAYAMGQRPSLDRSIEAGFLGTGTLYNRLILSQALAGTAIEGMGAVDLLANWDINVDSRSIGSSGEIFTPQESIHWKLPPRQSEHSPRHISFLTAMDDDTFSQLLEYFQARSTSES